MEEEEQIGREGRVVSDKAITDHVLEVASWNPVLAHVLFFVLAGVADLLHPGRVHTAGSGVGLMQVSHRGRAGCSLRR